MPTNAFLPFATGNNANVLSDAAYPSSPVIAQGVQIGVADPQAANKAWRQSSVISAMIGQFIVDYAGADANDSQPIAALEANFRQALVAASTGNYAGERTYLYKAANQALAQAGTEYDVTWDAPAANPSWATFDGTAFTVTQKCTVLSFAAAVVGVSVSGAGFAEADLDLYLNGPDYENTGQSAWPSSNTTYLPYLRLGTPLDLNVGDVLKVRVSSSATNFNVANVIGNTSGSYGVKGKSTAWKLICLSKG